MKSVRFVLILACLCIAVTACSTNPAEVETSPTVIAPIATATPTTEAVPQATSNFAEQSDTFIAVGEEAVITVGTTKLESPAYYPAGDEKTILLPFVETCKALGWQVEEPGSVGAGEMKLTQKGMDDVTVKLTVPASKTMAELQDVSATKGDQAVNAAGEPFAWIDGQLYATEKFISAAVQKISVEYDGEKNVTVSAEA